MTPAEARRAVYEELVGDFQGTLAVGEVWEDAEGFVVEWGHREQVVDDDVNFMLVGAPLALVDKATGAVSFVPYFDVEERLAGMTSVAVVPGRSTTD